MEHLKKEVVDGKIKHFSVLAIIERNGKYLMEERNIRPYGYSMITGHIDEGEEPIEALRREIYEETGMILLKTELIFEGETKEIECPYNSDYHHWYVFRADIKGEPKLDTREVKSIGWYDLEEIKDLTLSPVAEFWLEELEML